MNRPFLRTTNYPSQRQVIRLEESTTGSFKCNCKKGLSKIADYTYYCQKCKEEYTGPLLESVRS